MQKANKEEFIVDRKGRKTAVIIPIKKYEEILEDMHDLSIVAERRKEPVLSFDKLKKKLRKR